MTGRQRLRVLAAATVALATLATAACSNVTDAQPGASGTGGGVIRLVGYSAPQAADDALAAAWGATPDGKGVTFQTSYGASGDQSRNVAGGQAADYVHFSVEGDVTRLVDKGLVDKSWDAGSTKGIVSTSVVVLVVRHGNPLHISGWDDLVKPGVKVVTPNPGSSGSARWNILAAWAHATHGAADGSADSAGTDFVGKLLTNVVALPGSARDATTAFTGGTGDVLLSYENEAIRARAKNGDDSLDYVVPADTLLIQNPGAVLKDANPKAASFLRFALSDAGQHIFAEKGFRPLSGTAPKDVKGANDPTNPYPTPSTLYTISGAFGGWSQASKKFFADGTGLITVLLAGSGSR